MIVDVVLLLMMAATGTALILIRRNKQNPTPPTQSGTAPERRVAAGRAGGLPTPSRNGPVPRRIGPPMMLRGPAGAGDAVGSVPSPQPVTQAPSTPVPQVPATPVPQIPISSGPSMPSSSGFPAPSPGAFMPTTILPRTVGALLEQVKGDEVGRRFALLQGDNRLGRGLDCHVPISDSTVSGRHAILRVLADQLLLFDDASTNGTYVDGELVMEPRSLRDGDQVTLGRTTLVVRLLDSGR